MRKFLLSPFCLFAVIEKYYPISPYVYCAGNPINATDPTGMEIKVDEGLSEEEKRILEKMQECYKDKETDEHLSTIFEHIWNTLENSDKTYIITFGKTEKISDKTNAIGHYDPNTKKMVYTKDGLEYFIYLEEIIHAYQDENGILTGKYNAEFEVKIILYLIANQLFDIEPYSEYPNPYSGEKYKTLYDFFDSAKLNINFILDNSLYKEAGLQFVKYHKLHNCNSNYTVSVDKPSMILKNLVNLLNQNIK